ncbi:transcriptional regulator swi6 [Dinochytrium kinnereticum]|nr:transcriptional regulator swi6 [Dinochytrium kinnereticum]
MDSTHLPNAPGSPPPELAALGSFAHNNRPGLLDAPGDPSAITHLIAPSPFGPPDVSIASSSYSSSSSAAGTTATTPVVPPASMVPQVYTMAPNASGMTPQPLKPKPDSVKASPAVLRVRSALAKSGEQKPAVSGKGHSGPVYGAIYSGVPVYEMMCREIAMMRRRSDSFVNATQILKAAGIEKGKRTKILDKEIALGVHEKIQGGYGKYQGTWIPYERGLQLAQEFHIYDLVKPLFDLDCNDPSKNDNTPTKGEHLAALKRSAGIEASKPSSASQKAKSQNQAPAAPSGQQPLPSQTVDEPTHTMTRRKRPLGEGKSGKASRSETPSSPSSPSDDDDSDYVSVSNEKPAAAPQRKKAKLQEEAQASNTSANGSSVQASQPVRSLDRHRAFLLAIFVDNDNAGGGVYSIPESLSRNSLSPDFDIDLIIDDQGHTALHWAAALARIGVLQILLERGANPKAVNFGGESAVIRAVLVPNCFEAASFEALLNTIGNDVILMADARQRTALHHIALISAIKARAASCKYYLDCIIEHFSQGAQVVTIEGSGLASSEGSMMSLDGAPSNSTKGLLKKLLDTQDVNGDTALNVAARIGNRVIVERLLQVGADPKIPNLAGLVPSDFGMDDIWRKEDREILETLTIKNKPKPSFKDIDMNGSRLPGAGLTEIPDDAIGVEDQIGLERKSRDISEVVHKMVSNLNETFTDSLREKHERLLEAQLQLRDMSRELSEIRRENEALRSEAKNVPELSGRLRNLYRRFHATSNSPLMTIIKKYIGGEIESEGAVVDAADIADLSPVLRSGSIETLMSKKVEVQEMLSFVKTWQKMYEQDIRRLNSSLSMLDPTFEDGTAMDVDLAVSEEQLSRLAKREMLCRKIVAASCSLPLDAVDRVLEPLLEALEGDADTGKGLGEIDIAGARDNLRAAFTSFAAAAGQGLATGGLGSGSNGTF